MSRKAKPADQIRTQHIQACLTPPEVEALDRWRGAQTRSDAIRALILAAVSQQEGAQS